MHVPQQTFQKKEEFSHIKWNRLVSLSLRNWGYFSGYHWIKSSIRHWSSADSASVLFRQLNRLDTIPSSLFPGNRSGEIKHSSFWQNSEPEGNDLGEHFIPVMKQVIQLVKQLTPLSLKICPELTGIPIQNSSDRTKNAGMISLESIVSPIS